MNEILNNIKTRRSIRSFTDEKIPKEALEQIVEAGRYAPSAMNRQLCRFTVVQNPVMIEKLAAAIRRELNRDSSYHFYAPNVMLLVSNERSNPHGIEDCACALENIFLAAESLGIGSVWINQFRGICGRPEIRRALSALGLPEDHNVWGCAALGYPAQPNETPRKQDAVAWF